MKNKYVKYIRTAGVAICLSAFLLTGCAEKIKGIIDPESKEESSEAVSENSAEETIEVGVSTPDIRSISISSNFSGTVTAESEVTVIPMIAGEVVEKNFEVGDHVNEGDLLFRLDDTAVKIAVNQAEAAVTSAQAGLNAQSAAADATKAQATQTVGEIPYNAAAMSNAVDQAYAAKRSANNSLKTANLNVSELQEDIDEVNSALDSLKGQRDSASAKNDAMQAQLAEYNGITDQSAKQTWLSEHGYVGSDAESSFKSAVTAASSQLSSINSSISTQENAKDTLETSKKQAEYSADSAEMQYYVTQSSYGLAEMKRDNYNTYTVPTTLYGAYASAVGAESSVTSSAAAVKQAQAGLDQAKLQLDYTTVNAPVSGTITAINVSLHNMASQTTAAYTIQSDEPNKVVFYVAEQTAANIKPGGNAVVSKNGKDYAARIISVGNTIDPTTLLFKVEATVPGAGNELISGSSVSISTATRQTDNAVTVPIDSVYYDGEQPYLYVNENNVAKRINVVTGLSDDKSIEIIEGIGPDAEVITTWASNLKDGMKIEAQKTNAMKEIK